MTPHISDTEHNLYIVCNVNLKVINNVKKYIAEIHEDVISLFGEYHKYDAWYLVTNYGNNGKQFYNTMQ